MIEDEDKNIITPSSTVDILSDKIIFTQIVEKTQIINTKTVPVRTIDVVS
jgi:hypothetical protein